MRRRERYHREEHKNMLKMHLEYLVMIGLRLNVCEECLLMEVVTGSLYNAEPRNTTL